MLLKRLNLPVQFLFFFDRCFESERVRKLRRPERSQIPFSCFDELFLPKCVKCVISNFKQYLHELFSVLFLEYLSLGLSRFYKPLTRRI